MAIRREGGKLYLDVMVIVYDDPDIPWSGQRDPYQLSQWLKQDIEKASRTSPNDSSSNRVIVNIRKTHEIDEIPPRVSPDGDADYNAIIDGVVIEGRTVREWIGMADNGDIDEVWLWSSSNGHFEEPEVHPKSCTDPSCVYCDTLDPLRDPLGHGTFTGIERRDEPVGGRSLSPFLWGHSPVYTSERDQANRSATQVND